MNELRALESLITGYVNQDWPEEYGDPWVAVATFARQEPVLAPLLHSEILITLEELPRELDLERHLDSLALGYAATADGWGSHREWLLAVADRVDELLRAQAPERAD